MKGATADVNNKSSLRSFFKRRIMRPVKIGKTILATEPDNAAVNIIMGLPAWVMRICSNESAQYAKKAIQLIEAGKPFCPLTSKIKPWHI